MDEQAAMLAGLFRNHSAYWVRCSELRRMGFIAPTGELAKSHAGQMVMLCQITDKGLEALARSRAELNAKGGK